MKAISQIKNRMDALLASHEGSLAQVVAGRVRRALESDFVRKVLETFATRILLIGIGLATSVLIARILGPEGRGLFAVAGTILCQSVSRLRGGETPGELGEDGV